MGYRCQVALRAWGILRLAPMPYLHGDRSRHTTASARGGIPIIERRATAGPGLCATAARALRLRLVWNVLQEMRSSRDRTLKGVRDRWL